MNFEMPKLILNPDDFGISPLFNKAILEKSVLNSADEMIYNPQ
jgi:predicted glycoside hydrolase/deacetylase ChbG (UPF0249 family)